ncbi:MAG: DUF4276 family protein [Acidobacteria bacterium]|nr:DUF4276 family protein [Acidobacteriota bacterium]
MVSILFAFMPTPIQQAMLTCLGIRLHPFASAEALEIEEICRILVAVVPVRMTESWLLADVDVLRSELETQLTPRDLGLHKPPESYADPKSAIEEALRLSQEKTPGRSRHTKLGISSLYQIIGQKADLSKLESLPSFRKFKAACRYAFKRLGYLY